MLDHIPEKKALSENKEIRISYKVYLMKTYHYCFIGYDKGIILMLDVKNRKSWVWCIYKPSVLSL